MNDRYTYRLSWSQKDQEYVGICAEFPSMSHLASDQVEALRGIHELVMDVIVDMQANGEPVPQPLAEQHFSGKFVVRVPPELHRRLAIEAAEAHVSLNCLASFRLSVPTSSAFEPAAKEPGTVRAKRGKHREAA
jgi:predicted HicB family RNase H-like nuclease